MRPVELVSDPEFLTEAAVPPAHAPLDSDTALLCCAVRWGSGKTFSFDTTLERIISVVTEFEAQIPSGKTHTTSVAVAGASTTDIASATLSTLGDLLVTVTARVAAVGRVLVVFKNEADVDASLPSGILRVAVTKFG